MKLFKSIVIFMLFFAIHGLSQQFPNKRITTNQLHQNEPTIAVSPLESDHFLAAWNDYGILYDYSKPGYAFSTDGGQNWSVNILQPPSGFTNGYDPSVAFDRYGNAFYCYIASIGIDQGPVYVSRTTDFGQNWNDSPVDTLYSDKSFMAVDNSGSNYDGRIYVSWTDFSIGDAKQIRFAYSTDHGQSFSDYMIMDSVSDGSQPGEAYVSSRPQSEPPSFPEENDFNIVQGAIPAVGPNGEVYVVWLRHVNSDTGYIKIRKSTDGGENFGSTIYVTSSPFDPVWTYSHGVANARSWPTIAVDPTNGYIYVAYIAWSGGVTNIYFIRSTDGGSGWSTPTTVTELTNDYQFFPWLTVDPLGYISLVYHHGFTQGTTKVMDVYVAESFDSGEDFTGSDLKITDTLSSPQGVGGYTYHYIGITSRLGGDIFPVWSDYRNDPGDIYVSPANILEHIANFNESSLSNATYSNSSRHLVKGVGYLHQVFASGGEIFYRRSDDDGESWDKTVRVTEGNGGNRNPCMTFSAYLPAGGPEPNILSLAWERDIGNSQYEVWYSWCYAQTGSWTAPLKLATVDIGYYQDGASPVLSYMIYDDDRLLVLVYCSDDGLYYRTSTDYGDNWSGSTLIFSSSQVRYPSLSTGGDFISLIYDIRPTTQGVYSRIFDGAEWTSGANPAEDIGTRYNRNPSIHVSPEGNLLATWRGQIYERALDPYYSIIFRRGFSDNTWDDDWFVVFEHEEDGVSYTEPSITYYDDGGNYGINILHATSANKIIKLTYDIYAGWNDAPISTSGRWPNVTEENETSGDPIFHWTDQEGAPYSIPIESGGGQEAMNRMLVSNSNPTLNPRENTNLVHKRRAVIQHKPSDVSLIMDINPIIVSTTTGSESVLPFRSHRLDKPINISLQNMGEYLGIDTLSLPADIQNLKWKWEVSVSTGQDSTGNNYSNIFKDKYNVFLHIRDVNTPNISHTANITNQPQLTINLSKFAGRKVIIKPEVQVINLPAANLDFAVGDVYSPVGSTPQNRIQPLSISSEDLIPKTFALKPNYPNPFNPTTTIAFDLPQTCFVELEIYDISARKVRTVVNKNIEAGRHQAIWDGLDEVGNQVASGVYFYRIQAREFTAVKKMMLLR